MSGVGHSDVIVVGAGVAGLAAATSLARAGKFVTVLERKPYVGGRAYSYEHPALQEVVDSQHVLLGCCTNLIELCEQAGTADKIRWYDEQTFLEPNGRASKIVTSGLPAPFHFAPSFLSMSMLGWKDKLGLARGLMEFFRGYPSTDGENVEQWLKRTKQTELAIRHVCLHVPLPPGVLFMRKVFIPESLTSDLGFPALQDLLVQEYCELVAAKCSLQFSYGCKSPFGWSLNEKSPGFGPGLFFWSVLSIAVWGHLICHV